ncbi:MAG: single-stranded-DNA-specific exonuclease RecJ [Capsulimonadaceae bacterium]
MNETMPARPAHAHVEAVWTAPPRDRPAEDSLIEALPADRLTARMLVNRGLSDPDAARAFLNPEIERLHDPMLLPDMDRAARRIAAAVSTGETIFIHGDYDVDGVTSTALYVRSLGNLGAKVVYRVPHRKLHGYDLKAEAVEWAHQQGATLVITTDCGTQAREAVKHANALGMTVIVTDHHEPGLELPPAYAVVNPHRTDSSYPFPNLAGVGVAFKTMQAVTRLLRPESESKFIPRFLDLVACGTIADVMPLLGENRIFAAHGLRALPKTRKVGLRALLSSIQYDPARPLTSEAISFRLAPRINAIGRLDDAALALELMLTDDQARAVELARLLHDSNLARQDEQARIVREAIERLAAEDLTRVNVIVIACAGWNTGVVGIVAGKLAEQFYRPAIVIGIDEDGLRGKGSARSIPGFDLHASIQHCRHLLDTCGGHEMAAGLSLVMPQLEPFRAAINEYAGTVLVPEDRIPKILFDGVVDPSHFELRALDSLAQFEPFGAGNPEPRFAATCLEVCSIGTVGKDHSHLKMRLRGKSRLAMESIAFGRAERSAGLRAGDRVSVLYTPQLHEYAGRRSVQLNIKDMRVA